ncbi:MAG: sodium:solute symporter family protein [Candidatus Omnitrophica bacterium]|nr:sodium:solute symporter family protein [Candidatus Omnitrophota bacterium]MCM8806732.1 sodium:solute symporter family protein [Candidatus Omnitrophota bacterium]
MGKFLIILVYLFFMLYIGAIASRKIKNASDYIVAGKTLGFWLFVLLIFGSTTSGMTILGVTGLGFVAGWPSFWEQIFVPLTCAIAITLYGFKIYIVCKEKNFLTIQDYLSYRFESDVGIRIISSLAVLVTSLIYLVGQYTAISIVLKWALGIGQIEALIIGVIIVLIYVLLGGLYAVSWTTLFQGLIIIFGVITTTPFIIKSAGGLTYINNTLAKIDPNFVKIAFPQVHPPYAPYAFCTPLYLISFFFLLAIGLGSGPHIINNVIAVKDRKYFKWSGLFVFIIYIVIMFLVKITGMAVKTLAFDGKLSITKPDDAMLAGINYVFGDKLLGFFAVIILSAVMSTTDRLLLVIGSTCGWDFYKKLINKKADDRKITLISRIWIITFALISFVLAIKPPQLLAFLIWMSIGIMLSTFVSPILFGLYWKRATKQGAIWSMISGFISSFIFGSYYKFVKPLPFHFSFYSFLISVFVMIVVSLLTPKTKKEILDATKTGFFIFG